MGPSRLSRPLSAKSLHHVSNGDGWHLALRRIRPKTLAPGRRPVVIVPGYGMNSFIFGFHPSGRSLEDYLADQGLEVWAVDLRAQGETLRRGGSLRFGLEDLAWTDLRCALSYITATTGTGLKRADILGASLGATLMYALAARGAPHMGSLVAIGGPLRWVEAHPLLRAFAQSPVAVGLLRFPDTRPFAVRALPLLLRMPRLLEVYLHPSIVDMTAMSTMLRTVETPSRHVNREIAEWIRDRDLVLRGINITRELGRVVHPLLCVVANADGIVPAATALSGYHAIGSVYKDVLRVGDDATPYAHADLFVATGAQERVFEPIARWLADMAKIAIE